MSIFKAATSRQVDISLLLLRIATGAIFAVHGGQKLFIYGFEGVAGGFAQMGVPLAGLVGPLVGLVEFFGGLALVAGLLTRPAAFGLAITALGATLIVHLPAGFFLPGGYEFVLMLFAASVALMLSGAGSWSVDSLLAQRRVAPAAKAASPQRTS